MLSVILILAWSYPALAETIILPKNARNQALEDLIRDLVPGFTRERYDAQLEMEVIEFERRDISDDQRNRILQRFRQDASPTQIAVPTRTYNAIRDDMLRDGQVSAGTKAVIFDQYAAYAAEYSNRPYPIPADCETAAFRILAFLGELRRLDQEDGKRRTYSIRWSYGSQLNEDETDIFHPLFPG
jgi:hypothetical protein